MSRQQATCQLPLRLPVPRNGLRRWAATAIALQYASGSLRGTGRDDSSWLVAELIARQHCTYRADAWQRHRERRERLGSGKPTARGEQVDSQARRDRSSAGKTAFLIIVHGPAEVDLQSPLAAKLWEGSFSVDVPAGAQGFAVRTPNCTITDLGTRFGVACHGGKTDVEVFTGSVLLWPEGRIRIGPEGGGLWPRMRSASAACRARRHSRSKRFLPAAGILFSRWKGQSPSCKRSSEVIRS